MSNTIFLWMKTGDEMANAYSTLCDRWLPVQRGVKDAISLFVLAGDRALLPGTNIWTGVN
ncbi:hypothetical protein H6F50_24725 [Coleofasciculus sp. FACHB-712]|uniref:hypothetical protein n=1 Tax=Coleofasciculus sp. FACHB-712 TaxID=2692789 RepID=UPI0016825BCA|nr:hypothetical protein [Coleofasciculus sp. FACHB-712]MBD1945514.1 hypothetical protein [Coleofasciculus sp. FACHB-712]